MNIPNFRLPADFFFIDKVLEPLTQKIQKYFGLDCFFWAKICSWFSLVCAGVTLFCIILLFPSCIRSGTLKWSVLLSLLLWVYIIMMEVHWKNLRSNEEEVGINAVKKIAYEAVERGEKNPLIFKPRSLLGSTLGLILMILMFELNLGVIWIFIGFIPKVPFVFGYFTQCLCSCTPLPPKKSVLRSKVEAMQELFVRGFSGSPEPEPA